MRHDKTPLAVLLLSHVALACGLALTYHRLPGRLASHFNAAGMPDGWMSRATHIGLMGGTALFLTALMLGLFYGMRFFPTMLNVPHRDFWLAPKRSEQTFDALFRAGVWLASFEALFLLGLHLLVVEANATQPVQLSSGIWALGGGFLAVVAFWVFALVRRFSMPAS